MVQLFPRLIESRSKPPEIPTDMAGLSTQAFFDSISWDTDVWDDGQMLDVLAYIRGNNSLNLGVWRSSFPQEL